MSLKPGLWYDYSIHSIVLKRMDLHFFYLAETLNQSNIHLRQQRLAEGHSGEVTLPTLGFETFHTAPPFLLYYSPAAPCWE